MSRFRRPTATLLLVFAVFTTASALEVQPGVRGALAIGAEGALIMGGVSCAVEEDPVSLRGEGALGFTDGRPAWEGALVLGYALAVPWQLQPVLEIGVSSAGDGQAVSVYPVVGMALGVEMSRWLYTVQVRYQSTPFPLPFDPAPEYSVRPLVIVLGVDRILKR